MHLPRIFLLLFAQACLFKCGKSQSSSGNEQTGYMPSIVDSIENINAMEREMAQVQEESLKQYKEAMESIKDISPTEYKKAMAEYETLEKQMQDQRAVMKQQLQEARTELEEYNEEMQRQHQNATSEMAMYQSIADNLGLSLEPQMVEVANKTGMFDKRTEIMAAFEGKNITTMSTAKVVDTFVSAGIDRVLLEDTLRSYGVKINDQPPGGGAQTIASQTLLYSFLTAFVLARNCLDE